MTPLDAALAYADEGKPVFPCIESGPGRKRVDMEPSAALIKVRVGAGSILILCA
jgi:hypothetical protein